MKPVDDVTIFIKTYRRDDCCTRLINSIRKGYPDIPIIVINDGNETVWEDDNCRTILYDEDVGVSRGRNEALRNIDTKYALQCDDDFIFTYKTDLYEWKQLLVDNDFDVLGSKVVRGSPRIFTDLSKLRCQAGSHYQTSDYDVADIVQQFLLLDVERVLSIGGWDEDLDMCEHWPFMQKLKIFGFKVGVCKKISGTTKRDSNNQKQYDVARQKKQRDCTKSWDGLYKRYVDLSFALKVV